MLQKGQRSVPPRRTDRAKAASPAHLSLPPPSPLCCHGMSPWVMVSLATGCFLCSEGDAGGLLKVARGGGRRETGVQSDIGWRRELWEQGKQLLAIIHSVSVFSFPSFSLINTGP